MLVTPNKFQGTESSDVCMTPVSVVLEGADYEVLSPAEVSNLCVNHFRQLSNALLVLDCVINPLIFLLYYIPVLSKLL